MELFAFPTGLFTNVGTPFLLKGVNWFGFETETFCPHGLWRNSMDYLLNFLKKEKVNAIRVPISVEAALNLNKKRPRGIDFRLNPDLEGKTAGEVMDVLVKKCRKRGIMIMPSMHRMDSTDGIPELWYSEKYPESRIIEAWKHIVSRYKNDPTLFAIDLKNEPHGVATWGDGNLKTDWAMASERIGNAILRENPKLLIFVEGISTTKRGETSWWGGVVDKVRERPVRLSVKNKLVYSPHVYGPDVFMIDAFKQPDFPRNLPAIWDAQWGYLRKQKLAPIVIGEWGGRNEAGTKDRAWHDLIKKYFVDNGFACATFYWSLNPNSGDTKGLLEDDWMTPVRHKLDAIGYVCPNPTDLLKIRDAMQPLPSGSDNVDANNTNKNNTESTPFDDWYGVVPSVNNVIHKMENIVDMPTHYGKGGKRRS